MANQIVITDPEARLEWRYGDTHGNHCQVCHQPANVYLFPGFDVHHIIGGANGRDDEPCNWLLLCGRCHRVYNGARCHDEKTMELLPAITLGMVLLIKSLTGEWDQQRLTQLYHKRLPEGEELPDYYVAERTKWVMGSG